MRTLLFYIYLIVAVSFTGCKPVSKQKDTDFHLARAQQLLDSLYSHFSITHTCLLRETYPYNEKHTVPYLAAEEQANMPNPYSYLWPYSGTFSAVNALWRTTKDEKYQRIFKERILPGLSEYYDSLRTPHAYSSYVQSAPTSDRYYDDNIWIGLNFIDIYQLTKNKDYLNKATLLWNFVETGSDEVLGGGIYWNEQQKTTKNTCSNAPGAVFAFKLFKATNDSAYFTKGKALYQWTKEHLQDTIDHLYFDHMRLDGKIGKAKYAYNSGQMMQAATLLYQFTGDISYLKEAQILAKGCYEYFFTDFTSPSARTFKMLKNGDIWFAAVLLRGLIDLYNLDKNRIYINAYDTCLDYAWNNARDENGLFNTDLSGIIKNKKKWLLTQAAMVEMYSRLAAIK